MTLRPRLSTGPAALVLAAFVILGGPAPASAAWDNVFQVCCQGCGPQRASGYAPAPAVSYYAAPSVSYSAPACPTACPTACPAPAPVPVVSYVQRCYYQPVTEYQRQSYYEPVKQNYTSYYMEPVTEYRYSTYYDPCTGCPQKVCSPVTSYRMRSQCNSVTSYVQRCALVPVTTLKPVTVRQPVVSYYYPPAPACDSCGPAAALTPTPSVEQIRDKPPAVMPQSPEAGPATIPPPNVPTTPGTSFQRSAPPTVRSRPERTASRSVGTHSVRGEIVANDRVTPRPGTKLVFVSAADQSRREYATSNAYGEFDVRLASGPWFVYVGGEDGRASYHKQLTLGDREAYDYRLVSR